MHRPEPRRHTIWVLAAWSTKISFFARRVSKYRSEGEAARWVATAATSPHVSGDAVDIGHSNATVWLSNHGVYYGLCRIYRNEPWHYELCTNAIDQGCLRMYADPTQDPRKPQ